MKISMLSKLQLASAGFLTILSRPIYAEDEIILTNPGGIDEIGPLVQKLIQFAFGLSAILTFAFLIWGGIEWITSGGDKQKYESARNRITAALVGLAIVAAAWALMNIVTNLLGIDNWTNLGIPGTSD